MNSNGTFSDWTFFTPQGNAGADSRKDGDLLGVSLQSKYSTGIWYAIYQIKPGQYYDISTRLDGSGIAPEYCSAVITWLKDISGPMIAREYLEPDSTNASSIQFTLKTKSPDYASYAEFRLICKWNPCNAVWRKMTLLETEAPPPRTPLIVTSKLWPEANSSKEANIAMMDQVFANIVTEGLKPDLIVFPENHNDRNVKGALPAKAETIPGPFFSYLSAKAKELNCYIATTMHEIDGGAVFNTGFICGRDGSLVGKYRKVHLTLSETEAGICPGEDFCIFKLDFANVGMAICWDNWFPETARILRQKGAEIIIFPLAGDSDAVHAEHVFRTRAIDNGIYLISSTGAGENPAIPSRIIDPAGNILAETAKLGGFCQARLDLDKKFTSYWLSVGPADGEARSLFIRERRPSSYNHLLR